MALVFKEPETFKTPDGAEYIILPVQADDMPVLFSITNKRNKLAKKKKTPINGEEFIKECGQDIQELINKTVLNIKTGESLPLKYRQPTNVLDLMGRIMKITTIESNEPVEEDGTTLEVNGKS